MIAELYCPFGRKENEINFVYYVAQVKAVGRNIGSNLLIRKFNIDAFHYIPKPECAIRIMITF